MVCRGAELLGGGFERLEFAIELLNVFQEAFTAALDFAAALGILLGFGGRLADFFELAGGELCG